MNKNMIRTDKANKRKVDVLSSIRIGDKENFKIYYSTV